MNTAIVVGHTMEVPGACSPHGIPCEWNFNFDVAMSLSSHGHIDVFTHDTYIYGYSTMVRRTAEKINAGDYGLVLELHYNASDNPGANGCEALYYHGNMWGKSLANTFCDLYVTHIGGKSRGAKPLSKPSDRGYSAVYWPRPTTLILEPFFGTNRKDVDRIRNCGEEYLGVIEELINIAKRML